MVLCKCYEISGTDLLYPGTRFRLNQPKMTLIPPISTCQRFFFRSVYYMSTRIRYACELYWPLSAYAYLIRLVALTTIVSDTFLLILCAYAYLIPFAVLTLGYAPTSATSQTRAVHTTPV